MGKKRENRGKMNMPRSGEKSGIGGQGGEINRVENVENVEWGVRGRPMVGAAVPCRPYHWDDTRSPKPNPVNPV